VNPCLAFLFILSYRFEVLESFSDGFGHSNVKGKDLDFDSDLLPVELDLNLDLKLLVPANPLFNFTF